MEVGDKEGEARNLRDLGRIAHQRGLYRKAQEYHEGALAIFMDTGVREGEVVSYINLGSCFHSLGKYDRAEEYFKKALRLSTDIGQILNEFQCLCLLTMLKVSELDLKAAFSYLFQSIENFDFLRGSLKDNVRLKMSLLEKHGTYPYKMLSWLLSSTAKPEDALYVEELRRARGLANLLATQYSVKEQITGNRQTWCGIQNVISRGDCACLYISIDEESVRIWVLKAARTILLLERQMSLDSSKITQESPPEYHSQIGAPKVGDPEVGEVIYNGRRRTIAPLPCARNEAEMIGRLLGVTPLTAYHATKEAVLQAINSVSLIHLAAHGDGRRGEIFLSPKRPTPFIPREEAYLLTMADISQSKLRAKLVVLSCCHSARGQIKAEGVIGIARAFIGSGARSVLAARWALDDTTTEKFLTCFYQHLFRGESASECLHEARKWMRNNGFEDVSKWASFMLIGNNVSFDFGKWPVSTTHKEP
ncbi:Tetratricopeptide repeat protein 28 [Stylophora pistillata]|uniref:Tetratricopeptide repeat protein 28 n=1 Tax=Stylophora pistillata TaxID=50429 RepID=A0A2B4SK38_STYPI|nr:Tetratricopeptide repeat protein 28 [Stylophora pistillata]